MKLGAKITLAALSVSVLFVNLGIYAVFQMTYQKNILTEQNRGQGIYRIINQSLARDFASVEEDNPARDSILRSLASVYEADFQRQGISIEIWRKDVRIYGTLEELPYTVEEGRIKLAIRGKRNEREFLAMSYLGGEAEKGYILCIHYPLTELNGIWEELEKVYLGISLVISVILLVLLGILLHLLLRPIGSLSKQVEQIRDGDYKDRLEIKGKDELAALGRSINSMADTIDEQVERLREENARKQQFIDDLSHEMKSPLTSIRGYAEYMMKAKLQPGESEELCGIIVEESNRLKDMSGSLLCLSELNHTSPEMGEVNIVELLREIRQRIANRDNVRIQTGYVTFEIDCKLSEQTTVHGNRELLAMLFTNLVENGIHACRRRYELTGIRQEKMEPQTDRAEDKSGDSLTKGCDFGVVLSWNDINMVTVTDQGIGISREHLQYLTQPFYRVDKGRSRREGGNGLGLAICRQIVEVHEGSLDFSSEEDMGTVVTVRLWNKLF